MRTIVIADVPYVHQLLEVYVSKLFSLSYWIASVEVHGANPIDHFVHRFTHRVKRGVLLAIGRPDGRLCSQTKCESWVLMAILQARSIVSLGAGAEVVTIGHNPHSTSVIDSHITLPSLTRPKFLCEKLLGVDEFEPMKRMASRKHVMKSANDVQVFTNLDSQVVGAHHYLPQEGTLRRARRLGLQMFARGRSEVEEAEMENPDSREKVLAAMDIDAQKMLDSQAALEEFTENRFLSLERLIAFQVMFHNMAQTVASLWPLSFDTWRSQSCLRIATTAAPVSAADLEREWMDSIEDRERDISVKHRSNSSRGHSLLAMGESFHGGSFRGVSPGGSHRGVGGILGLLGVKHGGGDVLRGEGSVRRRGELAQGDFTPGSSLRGGTSYRGGLGGIRDAINELMKMQTTESAQGANGKEITAAGDGGIEESKLLGQENGVQAVEVHSLGVEERVKGGSEMLSFFNKK